MASLQELQANFNAAFDALPVGQRIPWGGGTIYSMGGGRAYYDGPDGYRVLTKGEDVTKIAAENPRIRQQWETEFGVSLGAVAPPAYSPPPAPVNIADRPVPAAPTAQAVAAPVTSTGSPASGPQFGAAAQYFGQGTDQAGFTGTYKDPNTGKYMLPRYETQYNPQTGDVESVQVGWYAADGQNVGDTLSAYNTQGQADPTKNTTIADTSDTLLDKLIKGGILAGVGAGLGQLAGIGGQVAGAGDAFMPGALDATGAVIGDATMPGALGSFGANPAMTGVSGPLALGGLGGGTSALSSGTAGISGAGAAGTGTGSAAGTAAATGAAATGGGALGPAATAIGAAGKNPNVLGTIGNALGISGGTAATILGGLLGGQSNDESKTTANKLDPQMQAYLYGAGGLLPAVNSTLQSQLATGGLNALQRQGLTTQQNYLQSPEYAQQFAGLRNYGQGLLASGVAANPFAARGINGLL